MNEIQHRSKIEKSGWVGKVLCGALLLLCLVCAAPPLQAGGDLRETPPQSAGMGGSGCALPGAGLMLLNPALLAAEATGGAVYWTPSRFGFTELSSVAAEWRQALPFIHAGAAVQRFGWEVYSEHRFDAVLAREAAEGLAVGIRGTLHTAQMQHYGTAAALGLDAGVVFDAGGGWSAGAAAANFAATSFTADEHLPVLLRIGAAWATTSLRIACDLEKTARHPLSVRTGVEFRPVEAVALRVGAVNVPSLFTAGAGILLSTLQLHYAVQVHPDLGWTHTAGIGFQP